LPDAKHPYPTTQPLRPPLAHPPVRRKEEKKRKVSLKGRVAKDRTKRRRKKGGERILEK
jgi:hypothetical protein